MPIQRLRDVPGFSIDRVAAAAGDDPDVLRLENLDTDLAPPTEAIEATRAAIDADDANSCLPFIGRDDLKEAVARFIARRGGARYDADAESVITSGEGTAMPRRPAAATTDPGDEVAPHRPHLRRHDLPRAPGGRRPAAGAARRAGRASGGSTWTRCADAVSERTRAVFLHEPVDALRLRCPTATSGRPSRRCACERRSGCSTTRRWSDPLRRPAVPPPRRSARDGRAHRHGRLRVHRVPDDRLAGRLGGRPRATSSDVATVASTTTSSPVGLTQVGAAAALAAPRRLLPRRSRSGSGGATRSWPAATACRLVRAAGGWSLLLDVGGARARLRAASRTGCSSRRSRRRRCGTGARSRRPPRAVRLQQRAASSAWPCSASACAAPCDRLSARAQPGAEREVGRPALAVGRQERGVPVAVADGPPLVEVDALDTARRAGDGERPADRLRLPLEAAAVAQAAGLGQQIGPLTEARKACVPPLPRVVSL